MKRLEIVGMDGVKIVSCLVDVIGEDFTTVFRLPLVIPVIGVTLVDLDKDEHRKVDEVARMTRNVLKYANVNYSAYSDKLSESSPGAK